MLNWGSVLTERRKEMWTGQKEKLSCDAVAMETFSQPMGALQLEQPLTLSQGGQGTGLVIQSALDSGPIWYQKEGGNFGQQHFGK